MGANLGYSFYKDIYRIGTTIETDSRKISELLNRKMDDHDELNLVGNEDDAFVLTTSYPGLVSGTGLAHGIKGDNNDFKIGFAFDYTQGLPIIYGSSVKGMLRSVFPNLEKDDAIKETKYKWLQALINKLDDEYFLNDWHPPVEVINQDQKINISEIESEIFDGFKDGAYLSIYHRDIFYDALMVKSKNDKGIFLGVDYITPHDNPLKNPDPIKFLKVLPNVEFEFQFSLKQGNHLSAEQKSNLFYKILLTLGIGAKTNVGYGQFQ